MSVYIEGLEMPEDGRYTLCITHDSSGNIHWVFQNEDTYEFLKHGRVKELTPHGRLGDLDKLEQMFVDIDNAPYSGFDGSEPFYSAEDAAQIIRLSPTIIPAEPPKEETE